MLTFCQRPLKSVTTLMILQLLAMLFTLSAIIFVFIVTYQTTGQNIRVPIAANNQGKPYAEFKWTPETSTYPSQNKASATRSSRKSQIWRLGGGC
jgi:hypothetical protein